MRSVTATIPSWITIASAAGIADTVSFGACLDDPSARETVVADAVLARELGVIGTPSVLLDSLFFTGSPGLRYYGAYVKRILGR
jgi:2-hydroxychromene-2-carboxylate isomerase